MIDVYKKCETEEDKYNLLNFLENEEGYTFEVFLNRNNDILNININEFFEAHQDVEILEKIKDKLKYVYLDKIISLDVLKFLIDNNIDYYVNFKINNDVFKLMIYEIYRGKDKIMKRYIERQVEICINKGKPILKDYKCLEILKFLEDCDVDKNKILSFILCFNDVSIDMFENFNDICKLDYVFKIGMGDIYPLTCQTNHLLLRRMFELGYSYHENIYSRFLYCKNISLDIVKILIEQGLLGITPFFNPICALNPSSKEELIEFIETYKDVYDIRKDNVNYLTEIKVSVYSTTMTCYLMNRKENIEELSDVLISYNIKPYKGEFDMLKQQVNSILEIIESDGPIKDEEECLKQKPILLQYQTILDKLSFEIEEVDFVPIEQNNNDIKQLFDINITLRKFRRLSKRIKFLNVEFEGETLLTFHRHNHKIVNIILTVLRGYMEIGFIKLIFNKDGKSTPLHFDDLDEKLVIKYSRNNILKFIDDKYENKPRVICKKHVSPIKHLLNNPFED